MAKDLTVYTKRFVVAVICLIMTHSDLLSRVRCFKTYLGCSIDLSSQKCEMQVGTLLTQPERGKRELCRFK